MIDFKALLALGTLAFSPLALTVMQPPAAIASAPYFTTSQELEQKFKQVKIGWTIRQVEDLLGKPQWASARQGVFNYFVNQEQLIAVIKFTDGRVSSLGGRAG